MLLKNRLETHKIIKTEYRQSDFFLFLLELHSLKCYPTPTPLHLAPSLSDMFS